MRVAAEIYKYLERPAVGLEIEWEGREGTKSYAKASPVPRLNGGALIRFSHSLCHLDTHGSVTGCLSTLGLH